MDSTSLGNAASHAAATSKNIIVRQIDQQAHSLGEQVSQTARDLTSIAEQLRGSGMISSAAGLADWAARYVENVGTYLTGGSTDRFIADAENFGRERPWSVAASAAILGFATARVVKSSSVRRYSDSDYSERYANEYGTGSSYGTGSDYGTGTGSSYETGSNYGSGAAASTASPYRAS